MKFSMTFVYRASSLEMARLRSDLIKRTDNYEEIADTLDFLVKHKAKISHPQITKKLEKYRHQGRIFEIETGVKEFRFLVAVEKFKDLETIPELLEELGWRY
jgi:hypothetical protein